MIKLNTLNKNSIVLETSFNNRLWGAYTLLHHFYRNHHRAREKFTTPVLIVRKYSLHLRLTLKKVNSPHLKNTHHNWEYLNFFYYYCFWFELNFIYNTQNQLTTPVLNKLSNSPHIQKIHHLSFLMKVVEKINFWNIFIFF